MIQGGYQILNFNGVNFVENDTINIKNIFKKLSYTQKAIMISGLSINSIKYRDTFVDTNFIDNKFVINVYNFSISIDNDDNVVIKKISDNPSTDNTIIVIPEGSNVSQGVTIEGSYNTAKSAINNATPLVIKFGSGIIVPFYLTDSTIDSGGSDTNIYGAYNSTEFHPYVLTITTDDILKLTSY